MLGRLAHLAHGAVGRGDFDAVHRAVAAAGEAPGRRHLALEAEGDEGRAEELVLALDAETAAVAPGAPRILAQPVAENADGAVARLHDLHGIVAGGRAREDDHAGFAVVRGAPAGAARVEVALDEEPARLRVRAEGDGGHLVAVGAGG